MKWQPILKRFSILRLPESCRISFGIFINKITELNKTLEIKVKARTRDLLSITEELELTNRELNIIFNTAADGMRVIDKNYKILKVNDTFAKLIGKSKEAITNQLCHKYFKGKFCHSNECTLERIFNGEEHIEIDVEKELASGKKHTFLLTAIGVEIEAGKDVKTKTFYPKESIDISNFIQDIQTFIFDQMENRPFIHLKKRISMILEEALVNAWKHGNQMSCDKHILLKFSYRNDFVFEIIDQGNGFDFHHIPDPTVQKNIEKPSGKGLFIIHHFSDTETGRGV